MAGSGRRVWAADEVLAAADLQDYIQDQVVFVYNDASARTSGILSPTEGMVSYLKDSNTLEMFDGSNWVNVLPNTGTAGTYTKVTTDVKGRVTSGTTLSASDIPNLDASKITTGVLGTARIPDLDSSTITTGVLGTARIPSLDASKITTGTLGTARIPDLDGSKITTGAISNLNSLSTDIGGGTGFVTTNILNIKNTSGVNQAQIASTGAAAFKNTTITGTLNVTSSAAIAGTLTCAPIYSTDLSSSTRRTVWVSDAGLLGYASSTKTAKQDIVSTAIDADAVRKINVVDFRYKAAVKAHGDDAAIEVGVIAEQLLELGLDQFVFVDDAGNPAGVHYEMLSVAVLRLVQAQADRLDSLEARLAKLEK